ncbi:MAG TPA: DUF389 domain-containing protein [Gaiellaceae bacterium]|nr:DUF389 domain-containing protein [Gaiellaceae bacterium]
MTAFGTVLEAIRDSVVTLPTDEEREAVEGLIPEGDEFGLFLTKFTMLTILSAGIAAFGLLADSAAVVIGAMLVAPLMTPITAAAAATVTARNARLARSLAVIVLGTAAAIAVGYLTALLAGIEVTDVTELPAEVSARTFPGLLDLGIAVTAGAAAGYILPRRSTLAALPGVGIAVALVPPLATVGITLEIGTHEQAANAFLLYVTNLAAIIFSASVLLILSGFRPGGSGGHRLLARRLTVTAVAVVAVAIPLAFHTRVTIEDTSLRSSVASAVVEWDDTVSVVDLSADVADDRASVELLVSGPNEPRPAWQLASEIERRFGGPVDLRLLYQQDELFVVSVR